MLSCSPTAGTVADGGGGMGPAAGGSNAGAGGGTTETSGGGLVATGGLAGSAVVATAGQGTSGATPGTSAAGSPATSGSAAGGSAAGGSAAGGSAAGGDAGGSAEQPTCPFGKGEYFLWPGVAPGSEGVTLTEKYVDSSKDPSIKNRSVMGVSKPSVFAYLPDKPTGAAAIIAPGGGYTRVVFDKEGVDIALWLNSIGVSAFVLKYRLPGEFPGKGYVALADAQRALRTVRKFAGACGWQAAHIGVVGFSAGGHLASQLETRPTAQTSPALDDIDALSARPDFGILMYPVISMDASITHAGSRTALLGANPSAMDVMLASSELQVTAATPPTFIGVSKNDSTVNPENSVRFDKALQAAGVAHVLHLYNDGGHGVGIRGASGDIAQWPAQAATWLEQAQFLP